MSEFKKLQTEICEVIPKSDQDDTTGITIDICLEEKEKIEANEEAILELEYEPEADPINRVILTKEELFEDFNGLKKIFAKYTKNQQVNFVMNAKKLYIEDRPYYFIKESVKVQKIILNLKKTIIRNFIKYRSKVNFKELDKIKITFRKDKIKNIYVKTKCCNFVKLRQVKKLRKTDKNVVYYLKHFKDYKVDIKSINKETNWLDLSIKITGNRLVEKSLLPPDLESCIDFSIFDSLEEKLLSDSMSLGEVLQHVLTEKEDKTISELYKEDLETKVRKQILKNKTFKKPKIGKKKLQPKEAEDMITDEVLKKVYSSNLVPKEAFKLSKEVLAVLEKTEDIRDSDLSSLMVLETPKKLAEQALKNKVKFLSFDEVSRMIMEKTIDMSSMGDLEKIYEKIPLNSLTDIEEAINKEILKQFPDTITIEKPWNLEKKSKESCDSCEQRDKLVKKTIKIDVKRLKSIYAEKISELLSIDSINDILDNMPEGNYLKKIIMSKDSLLEELNPESLRKALIPEIPQIPNFTSGGFSIIFERIKDLLIEKIIDLINSLLIAILIKLIEELEKSLTGELSDLQGGNPKDKLKNLIKDAICSMNDSKKTEEDLLNKLSVPADMRQELLGSLGNNVTTSQFNNAILDPGNPKNKTVFDTMYGSLEATRISGFLQSPEDLEILFSSISDLLNKEQKDRLRSIPEDGLYINKSICLSNDQKNTLKDLREQNGLDPNLGDDGFKDIIGTLLDLPMNSLIDNIQDSLSPIGGINLDCFDEDDPLVDEDKYFIGKINDDISNILKQAVDAVYNSLDYTFTEDMIGGRNSFFDNLLADSRGIRLSSGFLSHDRRVAMDLIFPNAADTLAQHSEKYDNSNFLESFIMNLFSDDPPEGSDLEKPVPNHLFPETISLHCKEQLESSLEQLEFKLTNEMLRKGKKADARMEFRNKTKIEGLDFDYGFDILYKDFTYNQTYNRTLDFEISKIDLFKNKDKSSKLIDCKILRNESLLGHEELIEEIDTGEALTNSYNVYLMKKYFSVKNELNLSEENYENINNLIIKYIIKGLSNKGDKIPEGYEFGFIENRITYDDLLYVNPAADPSDEDTWVYDHEEEDKVLGKSATENPRVIFLDPKKYGGKYTKPKVYIENAKSDGWLRLFSKIIPEADGAAPKRENFLFTNDIKSNVKKYQKSIPNDKRFDIDPDCVQEPAFDKLTSACQKANLEGVIMATLRTYMIETVLRTLPLLSHLRIDFVNSYNPIFINFIIQKMKDGMDEQFSWPSKLKDGRYWNLFVDSSVDLAFRLYSEGRLKKDPVLDDLLSQANEISKNYIKPSPLDRKLLFKVDSYTIDDGEIVDVSYRGNLVTNKRDKQKTIEILNAMFFESYGPYYKDFLKEKNNNSMSWNLFFKRILSLKYIKRITREYDIYKGLQVGEQILNYLIQHEFKRFSTHIESIVGDPYIENLNRFLIGSSGLFINSPVYGSQDTPNLESIKSVAKNRFQNPLSGIQLSTDKYQEVKSNGGFFLEKYYRFEKKENSSIDFEGIKSIVETKDMLKDLKNTRGGSIYLSSLFGNAEILDETMIGSIGVKFGVRVCYIPPSDIRKLYSVSKFSDTKAYNLKPAIINVDGEEVTFQESSKFVPIVSYERDVLDRTLGEVNYEDANLGEDVSCYLDQLVETDSFTFLFNKIFATTKVSSLTAIYLYDGFIESVGIAESEREEGVMGSKGKWKEKILENTKDKLAEMFKSSYYSNDEKVFSDDSGSKRKRRRKLKGNMMPKLTKNLDKSVKFKQLRRMVDRPFDKFGNEHISPLDGLLGD